jgi:hypothetical protein
MEDREDESLKMLDPGNERLFNLPRKNERTTCCWMNEEGDWRPNDEGSPLRGRLESYYLPASMV